MSRVMVDLDGVVYDFDKALVDYLVGMEGYSRSALSLPPRTWRFYRDQWGWTEEQFTAACDRGVDAGVIFREGAPAWGSKEGLQALWAAGHTIHLVTARYFGSRSVENTHVWLSEHGLPYDSLTFSADKTVVDAAFYLDDKPENVTAIGAIGKRGVIFDQPWNQDYVGERAHTWAEFVSICAPLDDQEKTDGAPPWSKELHRYAKEVAKPNEFDAALLLGAVIGNLLGDATKRSTRDLPDQATANKAMWWLRDIQQGTVDVAITVTDSGESYTLAVGQKAS